MFSFFIIVNIFYDNEQNNMNRRLNIGVKINEWTIISDPIIVNGKRTRDLICSCGHKANFTESYINKSTFSRSCKSCGQIRRYNESSSRVYNIGDKLMNLEILDIIHGKRIKYKVKCLSCGNVYETGHSILNKKSNNIGTSYCNKCFTIDMKSQRKCKMLTEHISLIFYKKLIVQANLRGILFNVSPEYLESIYNGFCYLSNTKIDIGTYSKSKGCIDSGNASLDRIDSTKGYVENNVGWVSKQINVMKHILSVEDFVKLCKMVVDTNLIK